MGPFASGFVPWEGAPASLPIQGNLERVFPTVISPTEAALVAGIGGLLQGRFGWAASTTGQVLNTRSSDADLVGIVVPYTRLGIAAPSSFSWQTFDPVARAWRLRQGLQVTLWAQGNFWLRFAGGAYTGQDVYASLADGSAISGAASGAELTRFKVCSNVQPGGLAQVSSYAFFGG